jgi:hypothetical protein
MSKRTDCIELLQEYSAKEGIKIPGLKTMKLPLLKEMVERLGLSKGKSKDRESKDKDETTEYFKDLTKREPFLGMYKKDYAQNRERNRLVLQDAKGERIDKNTFNHHGIIITYNLLIESAEEEDFSTIIQHFNIKVKNGEVTFKG